MSQTYDDPCAELIAELKNIIRCFERDDFGDRRNSAAVLVSITRKQIERIREIVKTAE